MIDYSQTSDGLVADLVRKYFGAEPTAMAALAHGDAVVRTRYASEDGPSVEPLDGVEVLLRRAVALCWTLRDHHGPVSLVTERQAIAAGWPCAGLANRCVALGWALFLATCRDLASPLLLEPGERVGEAMVPLIRVGEGLPALRELLIPYYRPSNDDDALERAAKARRDAPAIKGLRVASLQERVIDWFGIDADADAADLACNIFGLRMADPNARAVHTCLWIITTAIHLGADMKAETVRAVRLQTERDARLAGAPGAAAANLAVLLGLAICHGRDHFCRLLPPEERFAAAVEEAGRQAQARRDREGDGDEVGSVELIELEDFVARGYLHVGRANIREVAWWSIRGDN